MDEEIPAIAESEAQRLDPRSIRVQQLSGWTFTAFIAAGSLAGLGVGLLTGDDMPQWLRRALPWLWLAVVMLMAWHAQWWPRRAYEHTTYRVDPEGIEIQRGVYWRVAIHVPRSRVQHSDVSQGPLERRYGLGTLVIYTAGTDHARVDLAGLEHGVALRLRSQLLPSGNADAV